VLPGLLRRCHEAREQGLDALSVWGSGEPRREFLHVDDLADACLFLMRHYEEPGPINVGTGLDVTIAELAATVRDIVAPGVGLDFDATKPDGTPRKVLDVGRLAALGWEASTPLRSGIEATYEWFLAHHDELRDGTVKVA
jgi:GDP-L-fucose synthase